MMDANYARYLRFRSLRACFSMQPQNKDITRLLSMIMVPRETTDRTALLVKIIIGFTFVLCTRYYSYSSAAAEAQRNA